MDSLLRFGAGSELYTFDTTKQISLRDNFRDVVTRTSRLPGLPGGFDEYGSGPAPTEIGNVQAVFWLEADTLQAMESAKRSVNAMAAFGLKRLYKQPLDTTQDERYCEARISSIDYTESAKDVPHRRLRVQVNFQVANPVWLTLGTESWAWGDGTAWGSGALWGGSPVSHAAVGADNTFSLTPGGNTITYPRITIEIPAAKSATNIRVQRRRQGAVLDEVRYSGTLSAGQTLEINCRAYSLRLDNASWYGAAFTYQTAAWMRLVGGIANDIRVLMDNAADEATIRWRYYEAYI